VSRKRSTVVDVTELVAALVPIHGMLAFLVDMDSLIDPRGEVLLLPCRMSITIALDQLITWFS